MKPPSCILGVKENNAATLSLLPTAEISLKGKKVSTYFYATLTQSTASKSLATEVVDFVIMNNFVTPNRKLICQQFSSNIFQNMHFPTTKRR